MPLLLGGPLEMSLDPRSGPSEVGKRFAFGLGGKPSFETVLGRFGGRACLQ